MVPISTVTESVRMVHRAALVASDEERELRAADARQVSETRRVQRLRHHHEPEDDDDREKDAAADAAQGRCDRSGSCRASPTRPRAERLQPGDEDDGRRDRSARTSRSSARGTKAGFSAALTPRSRKASARATSSSGAEKRRRPLVGNPASAAINAQMPMTRRPSAVRSMRIRGVCAPVAGRHRLVDQRHAGAPAALEVFAEQGQREIVAVERDLGESAAVVEIADVAVGQLQDVAVVGPHDQRFVRGEGLAALGIAPVVGEEAGDLPDALRARR